MDVCFTPMGATYSARDTEPNMERMNQVPRAIVSRSGARASREILILPNGATRVKRKILTEVLQ
jgi:hypothetical protein